MNSEERLDELVGRWLDWRREHDTAPDLDAICADDPELRPELEARIRGIESMHRFLASGDETNDPDQTATLTWDRSTSTTIPGYEILGQLGRGGMGIVYHARQQTPNREVALKMILNDGEIPPERLARFREETESLARMQHPNIIQIFEVGEHQGNPFFSMELLREGSLKDKIAGQPQPPTQAAEWIEVLALAIHAAHQRGVIHRDLKPANVLFGEESIPKIADFGLAKRSDATVAHTVAGDILGTPAYMAPEQAEALPETIGPAADVYALGVMLYELLTGRPPFLADSNWEVIRQVINEEPVPPLRLNSSIPVDLNTICLKCLEKQPSKRFGSAEELAEELRRFLDGKPILARPIGPGSRFWRWCRRKPALAGSLAALGLLIVSVLVGGNIYLVRFQREQNRRQTSEAIAEKQRQLADSNRQLAESNKRAADTAKFYNLVANARRRLDERTIGWREQNFEDLRRAAMLPPAKDEAATLRSLTAATAGGIDFRASRVLVPELKTARLAYSPDGSKLALAELKWHQPRIRIVNPETGKTIRTVVSPVDLRWWGKTRLPDGFRSVAFSPDGRWLVAGTRSGYVRRWDLHTDSEIPIKDDQRHEQAVIDLVFAPDGSAVYSLSEDDVLMRWGIREGWKVSGQRHASALCHLGVDPHGTWVMCVAIQGDDYGVAFLDPVTLERSNPDPNKLTHGFAVSPDGRTIAYNAHPLVELIAPRRFLPEVHWWDEPSDWTDLLRFSPNNQYLVARGTNTHRLLIRDAAGGSPWLVIPSRDGFEVHDFICSPDGRSLVVAYENRAVLYELDGLHEQTMAGFSPTSLNQIELSSDGHELATSEDAQQSFLGRAHSVKRWTLAEPLSPEPTDSVEFNMNSGGSSGLALSPAGTDLAFGKASRDGPGQTFLQTEAGAPPTLVGNPMYETIRFDRDGALWAASEECVFRWAAPDWKQEKFLATGVQESLNGITFKSIDGDPELALAGRRDGRLFFLDPRTQEARSVAVSRRALTAVSRNRYGTLAAVGSIGGELSLVSLPSGEIRTQFADAHADRVSAVRFCGDQLIVSGSQDRTVKFWTHNGDPVLTIRMPNPVVEVEVSADGKTLAILLEGERAARIWRLDRLRDRIIAQGIDAGF